MTRKWAQVMYARAPGVSGRALGPLGFAEAMLKGFSEHPEDFVGLTTKPGPLHGETFV